MLRLGMLTLLSAYVAYRLGLSISAVRARRAGDLVRAAELSKRGVMLMIGAGVGLTFVFVAFVLVHGSG